MKMMAEDLSEVLGEAKSYADTMQKSPDSEETDHCAGQIRNKISYMNEIINEDLALSNYEYDKKSMERKNINLLEICEKSVMRNQIKADEKKLTFQVSGVCNAKGDRKLLQKVFETMISNAIRYAVEESEIQIIAEEGSICIRNKTDQVLPQNSGKLWKCMVSQNIEHEKEGEIGLGIAEKIVKDHKWKYSLAYDKENRILESRITGIR